MEEPVIGNLLNAARFALAMRPVVKRIIDDLYKLTGGDVQLATATVERMRSRGYQLTEARRDVDAQLEALDKDRKL
jgi:hypothetical protein